MTFEIFKVGRRNSTIGKIIVVIVG